MAAAACSSSSLSSLLSTLVNRAEEADADDGVRCIVVGDMGRSDTPVAKELGCILDILPLDGFQ